MVLACDCCGFTTCVTPQPRFAYAAGAGSKTIQAQRCHTRHSTLVESMAIFDSMRTRTADRMDGVVSRLDGSQ
jgi:hypothetical protein